MKQKQAKLGCHFLGAGNERKWEKCHTIDRKTLRLLFDSSHSGLPQLHAFIYCFIDDRLITGFKLIYINGMPNLTLNIWPLDNVFMVSRKESR